MWTATSLLGAYRRGSLSPVEVVEASIRRIDDLDPLLGAVTTPLVELSRAQARVAERRWLRGTARPLEGVPVLVKDLLDTAGSRTTYGSAMFEKHVPDRDAEVVGRIRRAGGIVLAKTATHEFGWGITTESERYGPTRNPWSPERSPGGSSGGSAAGLAAGYAPLAVGSDTAGSIRVPAAFCGVAGLKPTFGAVPTAGVRPLAPSLDHVGPMAWTAEDLALLWSVMAGLPVTAGPSGPVPVAAVGILTDPGAPTPAPAVAAACSAAATTLARLGHRVVEVTEELAAPAFAALGTTVLVEGIETHRRTGLWPGRADSYGADVRARLELAEGLDPAEVDRARASRDVVRSALAAVFAQVDVVVSPVSAVPPCEVGRAPADYRERVLPGIAPQSVAGLPSLAVRAGFDDDGMPVGLQMSAAAGQERRLLHVGARFQEATSDILFRRPTTDIITER